ncbi:MAG: metal ABC transporter solute-binding protein, Zn/Mn family [Thermodesulfobacteriota bacterium]
MGWVIGKISFFSMAIMIFWSSGAAGERVAVFVSIAPQKYFVQQIGKNLVDVQVMVAPGSNPHAYEPKPRQMRGLAKARLYFAVGVPFETVWLKKIAAANPGMKIIHTDQGIGKLPMTAHDHDHQDRNGHGVEPLEPEPGGLDPHIWLSPPLVRIQAGAILKALEEMDPVHGAEYRANHDRFVAEIDRLDNELKQIFAGKKGLRFIVFHPAWGYFADAYGLEQMPIELEGKDPKPARLRKLIEHAREKGVKVIFVQPQFSGKSAALVAREIGGQVAFADPLAEDWAANLRQVADQFKTALK